MTGIDDQLVRKGKHLSADDAERLVKPVCNEEIDVDVKGIDTNKAPRLDGFNSLFFIKAWDVIKDDMYAALKDFFNSGIMLRQVNNTLVTLIPKV